MRCVLHIGADKTGTFSIQRTLAANPQELAANRLHYLAAGRTIAGTTYSRQIGFRFAMSPLERPARDMQNKLGLTATDARRRYRDAFESSFDSELSALAADVTVLLSDEALFQFADRQTAANAAAFLDRRFSEVSIVCYLRRPDSLLASRYSQHVKTGGTLTLAEFVQRRGDKLFYFPRLKAWSDAFRRSRLTIRAFDRHKLLNGDVIDDFCALVGQDAAALKVINTNRSLTPLGLSLLRRINRIPKPQPASAVIRRAFEASFTGKGITLPPPLRDFVLDAWRQDHARIVNHFMAGREADIYRLDDVAETRERGSTLKSQSMRSSPRA